MLVEQEVVMMEVFMEAYCMALVGGMGDAPMGEEI